MGRIVHGTSTKVKGTQVQYVHKYTGSDFVLNEYKMHGRPPGRRLAAGCRPAARAGGYSTYVISNETVLFPLCFI